MMPHGERIRSFRAARGWTQDELARASGTTTRTVQRAEAGQRVSAESLKCVASALEVDFDRLTLAEPSAAEVIASREELEAELRRREEIRRVNDGVMSKIGGYWESLAPGCTLSESQRRDLHKWVDKFSANEVLEAMDVCARQYLEYSEDGQCTPESLEIGISKIPAVCHVKRRSRSDPALGNLYMIRGAARNRITAYFNDGFAMRLLKTALTVGVSIDALRELATSVSSWTQFRTGLEELIENPPPPPHPEHRPDEGVVHVVTVGQHIEIARSLPSLTNNICTELTTPADPLRAAGEVLQRGYSEGEQYITIDVEEAIYYFGRARHGFGTTYPIEQAFTRDELANAIARGFEYSP